MAPKDRKPSRDVPGRRTCLLNRYSSPVGASDRSCSGLSRLELDGIWTELAQRLGSFRAVRSRKAESGTLRTHPVKDTTTFRRQIAELRDASANLKMLSVRVSPDLLNELSALGTSLDCPRSDLTRHILKTGAAAFRRQLDAALVEVAK